MPMNELGVAVIIASPARRNLTPEQHDRFPALPRSLVMRLSALFPLTRFMPAEQSTDAIARARLICSPRAR